MGNREALARYTGPSLNRSRESPRCVRRDRSASLSRHPSNAEEHKKRRRQIDELSEVIVSGEATELTYCRRGVFYTEIGCKGEALCDFNSALNLDSECSEAYFRRGVLFFHLGLLEDSLRDLTRTLDLSPKNALALYHLGNVHFEMGSMDLALMQYDQAIEIDPSYAIFYYSRATLCRTQCLSESSVMNSLTLTDSDSQSVPPDSESESACFSVSTLSRALSDYNRAHALMRPTDDLRELVLYWRGIVLRELGKFESSLLDLNESIRLARNIHGGGDVWWRYYDRAVVQWKLGRDRKSVRADLGVVGRGVRKMVREIRKESKVMKRIRLEGSASDYVDVDVILDPEESSLRSEKSEFQIVRSGVLAGIPRIPVSLRIIGTGSRHLDLSVVRQEVRMMRILLHKNVIRCYGMYGDMENHHEDSEIGIVFEGCYGPQNDLQTLGIERSCSLGFRLSCLSQLAHGILFLHSLGLVHRNLRPDNIFLTREGLLKIGGFGLHVSGWNPVSGVSTGCYRAPTLSSSFRRLLAAHGESAALKSIGQAKDDIYSFGILGWELITSRLAFSEPRRRAVEEEEVIEFLIHESEEIRRPRWDGLGEPVLDVLRGLLSSCWDPNDEKRPSIAEIVRVVDQVCVEVGGKILEYDDVECWADEEDESCCES